MINFGQGLILFTSLTTLIAMIAYAPGVRRAVGNPWLRVARPAVYVTALGLLASAGYLWYLILSHQYQYDYVFRYSSNDMQLRYIIASFWGGQEGTFLLWAVYGGLLAVFLRFKAKQYEAPVQFFYLGINLFLMFMMIKASPFAKLPVTPADGNGLNPLLRDPWMTIHPPVMFFGFASLGIPAAYAMAAMVKEDWDQWVHRAVPWTIFGIMALGTGLVMGGYWAYSILGWGGFWGWDPVENSSLVPWLVAVALLHNQIIQMKRGIFRRSNLFLAMFPFLLLTYSTFLTRSGVLADFSVHSFTDLGINQFLAAFMIVFLAGGLGLFAYKFRRIPTAKAQSPLASREYFLFLGALSFGLFAVFVLLGTSAPLISRLASTPSNVQPEFYNRMALPFAILIAVLMSVAPHLMWNRVNLRMVGKKLLWPTVLAVLAAVVLMIAGVHHPAYLLVLAFAFLAVFSNAMVVGTFLRRNWSAAGGYMAHIGMGLALLGIIASTVFSQEKTVVLPQDEEVLALGYGFSYMGNRLVEGGRKSAYDVTLRTADGVHIVSPTMYFSDFNAGMMKKPDIESFWNRDVYIAPIAHAVDPVEERVTMPFMLQKDEPVRITDKTFTLLGVETASSDHGHEGHGGHNHPATDMTASIRVEHADGSTETVQPVLRSMGKDDTQVLEAEIASTGERLTLNAVDMSGTRAQVGLKQAPFKLARGESFETGGIKVTFESFDVDMGKKKGSSVKVYANTVVDVDRETYALHPSLISRPGAEELELVEDPIGRTGLNLVLYRIDPDKAEAFFYVTRAPQEYLYAEVSLKPFISLLWIGTVLTVLGLAVATFHRGRLANRLAAAVKGGKLAVLKKNGDREAA